MRAPGRGPGEAAGMLESPARELLAARERLFDPGADRLRALGIDADGGVTARLVERGVTRDDARRAARHCLDHRHPEALEAGGIDEHARAAVQGREPRRF